MNERMMEYARQMIARKGFDEFTSEKVMDYIVSHDAMYGDIIKTVDVIDSIERNLSGNIIINLEKEGMSEFQKELSEGVCGAFNPFDKTINVYEQNFSDDNYFHELDHCATDRGIINTSTFEIDGEKMETIDVQGTWANDINEGITEIKQEDYAKLKGIDKAKSAYDMYEYKLAKQLSIILGKEKILQLHFNHDEEGLKKALAEYGLDYNKMRPLADGFHKFFNSEYEKRDGKKLQEMLSDAFVVKRMKQYDKRIDRMLNLDGIPELLQTNISFIREQYRNLPPWRKGRELAAIQEFMQYDFTEQFGYESSLRDLQQEWSNKTLLQDLKEMFQRVKETFMYKPTKGLPEPEVVSKQNSEQLKPWDLRNWNIDKEAFREEANQIAMDTKQKQQTQIPTKEIQVGNDEGR